MAGRMRPQKFTTLVGQPYATGVGRRIAAGAAGQGYLLAGPRGCGKTSLARIVAKSVNCLSPDPDTGDPCLSCEHCVMIDQRVHPRVEEINAAANRGVADIREKLSTLPLSVPHGKRVYILDEAHMLTREAFSLLLKPMEEPPEDVMFLLTTTHPESIPDTIVSRCALVPILPLTDDEIREVLDAVIATGKADDEAWNRITDDDVDAAVLTCSGSARQAITSLTSTLLHGVSATPRSEADRIVQAFRSGSAAEVLSLVSARLTESKEDPSILVAQVCDGLIKLLGSGDDERIARQIAALSTAEVTLSTPVVAAAARIAACVPVSGPVADQVAPAATKTTSDRLRPPQSPNPRPVVEQKRVTESLTVDEVMAHVETAGRRVLSKRWRDVLDDPDRSDIEVDGGVLSIRVDRPSRDLVEGLEALFTSVEVSRL